MANDSNPDNFGEETCEIQEETRFPLAGTSLGVDGPTDRMESTLGSEQIPPTVPDSVRVGRTPPAAMLGQQEDATTSAVPGVSPSSPTRTPALQSGGTTGGIPDGAAPLSPAALPGSPGAQD